MSTKQHLLSELEGFINENEDVFEDGTNRFAFIRTMPVRAFVTELINDNFSEQTGWSDADMIAFAEWTHEHELRDDNNESYPTSALLALFRARGKEETTNLK